MALKPIGNGYSCTQRMLGLMNSGHSLAEDASDALEDKFEDSADFRFVYRNKFENNLLKAWITDGTTDDKLLGYKRMVSYPYKPIAFSQGDYLYFDYYDIGETKYLDWSPWLIYALDYQNYYSVDAKLYPCNQTIKWKSESKIIFSYPCYMEDAMKYTTLNLGQQGVVEQNADIVLFMQNNDDTNKIYINQRFLFSKRAYVVVQKNIEVNDTIIKLFINKSASVPNDDFENGIAYNGQDIEKPITPTTSEDLLLPNIDSIKLNQEISFNIYEYIDGIKTNTQFDTQVSGLDNSYYQLNIIDENNFTIKNLKQNLYIPLLVTCTNLKTTNITTKEIWLKGVF